MQRTFSSIIGELSLHVDDGALQAIEFEAPPSPESTPATDRDQRVMSEVQRQLEGYFAGRRKDFDLPLAPGGTIFQQLAWQALCAIPYGETRSYKEQAAAIGRPKAMRAIGSANNRNPIPVIIPCHRVIGANGALVGYAGGLGIKKTLLELEGALCGTSAARLTKKARA